MANKPYHHGSLEEALIEAGLSLINREGIERFSLRAVAAACGVSHAAPYKHFTGKEDLLYAVRKHVDRQFFEALDGSVQSCPAEENRIERLCVAYLSFFLKKPHYFNFLQHQHRSAPKDNTAETDIDFYNVFREIALVTWECDPASEWKSSKEMLAVWSIVHGVTMMALASKTLPPDDWYAVLSDLLKDHVKLEEYCAS